MNDDTLIDDSEKSKISDMNGNFARLREAYTSRKYPGDSKLRPWKQTHKRLIIELASALKLDVPKDMMVAFEDRSQAQQGTFTMVGPQGVNSFGPHLRPRPPIVPRSPSSRGRLR